MIGTGPAGIGLVLALCNRIAAAGGGDCAEQRLLDDSVFFEAKARPGGQMGAYRINANTSSHDVVQGIDDGTPFAAVRDAYVSHPETQETFSGPGSGCARRLLASTSPAAVSPATMPTAKRSPAAASWSSAAAVTTRSCPSSKLSPGAGKVRRVF